MVHFTDKEIEDMHKVVVELAENCSNVLTWLEQTTRNASWRSLEEVKEKEEREKEG